MNVRYVLIPPAGLDGDLLLPPGARGLVVFAHGSGSSRLSRRNQYVARALAAAGVGTLLMDLLTKDEELADARTAHLRFDIPLLARRLLDALAWAQGDAETAHLRIGLFGASTGAAAALLAAAEWPQIAGAVVSRGGRPDLAGAALPHVSAPTLLITGGDDGPVIELNERAYAQLRCEKRFEIIPGAGHLFEEPGKLEQVAALAADWFNRYL